MNIKHLPQGVKASIAFFFSNIITAGISYITTPLYTRVLSATEYGQSTVFFTWLQLFGIIAMFGLANGVFNNGMLDYPDKREEYSFSMLMLSNVITIIFSFTLFFVYPIIKEYIDLEIRYIVLMLVLFLVQPAYNFWIARQRYEIKYKYSVMWSVICALCSPIAAILLIVFSPLNRLDARIFGTQIVLIIIYIGFYLYQGIGNKWRLKISYWKDAVKFNLPLLPHYLSIYLLNSSDRLMISQLVSKAATAYYSVAYSVASIATIVWSAINSSLIPYTYENCKKKNYRAISQVTIPIMAVFGIVCTIVILFAPEVVAIMATKDYMEAIYVIPPIIGGVFFQVQYFIYANIVYYYRKPQYVMYASVAATFLNIVLNYICIKRMGYIAAGYTTLICYMLQAVMDYYAMKKVVKEKVYDMRYVFGMSLLIVIISLVSIKLYEEIPIIRYLLLIGILGAIFTLKNKIIKIWSQIRS